MSEQQELKDCPFCGEQINSKAIKCRHCGSMLSGGTTPASQPMPATSPATTPTPQSVPPAQTEKKPGCFKTTLYGVIGAICIIGGCNMLFGGGGGGVMPLDEYTMEKYKEASQDAAWQMSDDAEKMSGVEMASLSFRHAVEKVGYDPDKTILHWLSPEYQQEIKEAGMEDGLRMSMGAGLLMQMALGDGCSKKEFEQLISHWSPEVQEAAQNRRSKK